MGYGSAASIWVPESALTRELQDMCRVWRPGGDRFAGNVEGDTSTAEETGSSNKEVDTTASPRVQEVRKVCTLRTSVTTIFKE